jgi:hypothetical protein
MVTHTAIEALCSFEEGTHTVFRGRAGRGKRPLRMQPVRAAHVYSAAAVEGDPALYGKLRSEHRQLRIVNARTIYNSKTQHLMFLSPDRCVGLDGELSFSSTPMNTS